MRLVSWNSTLTSLRLPLAKKNQVGIILAGMISEMDSDASDSKRLCTIEARLGKRSCESDIRLAKKLCATKGWKQTWCWRWLTRFLNWQISRFPWMWVIIL